MKFGWLKKNFYLFWIGVRQLAWDMRFFYKIYQLIMQVDGGWDCFIIHFWVSKELSLQIETTSFIFQTTELQLKYMYIS